MGRRKKGWRRKESKLTPEEKEFNRRLSHAFNLLSQYKEWRKLFEIEVIQGR